MRGDKRVLLVDDSEVIRKSVRELLRLHPEFKVCGEARNGEEAIAQLATLLPDAVVLDITMPVMNGLEAARRIRQSWPSMKIVILTMHATPQMKAEADKANADAFLSKSEAAQTLIPTLRALLKGHSPENPTRIESAN